MKYDKFRGELRSPYWNMDTTAMDEILAISNVTIEAQVWLCVVVKFNIDIRIGGIRNEA